MDRFDLMIFYSMYALFSVCSLRDDNVITRKPTLKLKHGNSILESFEYFWQISSKLIFTILSYTVSKLGHFSRHSVQIVFIGLCCAYTYNILVKVILLLSKM